MFTDHLVYSKIINYNLNKTNKEKETTESLKILKYLKRIQKGAKKHKFIICRLRGEIGIDKKVQLTI